MEETIDGRWGELLTRRYAAAVTTLCLGVALYALNAFLVSTSLPTAVVELGGVGLISWAFTVFLVAAIVGGAASAMLKQRLGTRPALLLAALAFLAGTLVCGFATSMPMVLVGRVFQGAGEGVIAAVCYALIPEMFPSRLIPKVFGAEAIVWAAAAFGGPLLSGVLTETVSWRAAFLVNVPLIAIFALLVGIVVPAGQARNSGGAVPLLRLFGCAAGIMLVSVAGIVPHGWQAALCVAAAMLVLAAVVLADRRGRDRLFPSDAFTFGSTVGAGLWVVLLMPVAQAATTVYLNITIQHLWGYGPTMAGYVSALMALAWSGSAVLVAGIVRPEAQRRLIRLGPFLLALGLLGVMAALAGGQPRLLVLCQVLIGAGFGISWAFLSQAVMEAARPGERDAASALLPTLQSGGYAIGAAVSGLIANAAGMAAALTPEAIIPAATWVFGIAALLGTLGFLASFGVRPGGR
ncbi:MFS transporter [Inquilinus sp. Marseille-Q2685]|uniref:MFS transporter n=1 Tax=Inquilinus sp. Marseille-Q2685 TaxID=2866581 RepID=UPI001CE4B2BF|nr:MFS transporter [Inquilinus sp. Marseille-Q2685]